jgi:F0F1-type ATP synthase assembly protein I
VQGLFDKDNSDVRDEWPGDKKEPDEPFILSNYKPQSTGETVRQTGLAWSAGIAFFGAIVFMLFLGWIADLLIGSSPWGIVGGIVLGSIIGFMQFFRITSRIFKKSDSTPAEHPLTDPPPDPSRVDGPFDER